VVTQNDAAIVNLSHQSSPSFMIARAEDSDCIAYLKPRCAAAGSIKFH
jgi:hypothetical protein